MSQKDNIKVDWDLLMEKFINNTCSREEFDQLMMKLKEEEAEEIFSKTLKDYWDKEKSENKQFQVDWNEKFASMMQETKSKNSVDHPITYKQKLIALVSVSSAAVLLLILLGGYLIYTDKAAKKIVATEHSVRDNKSNITPGSNKAFLTLADGSTIVLDSANKGTLNVEGNTKVTKIDDGKLVYDALNKKAEDVLFNKVSTPPGGQYEVVLSDGTRVWLNAASSLKFPTFFSGKERNVVLTGEGYFEVAKNRSMPFNVVVNDIQVEVLGTHFNVSGYNDESKVETTLLEGSVKVTRRGSPTSSFHPVIISPGQRAQANESGEIQIIKNIDLDEAVAWKNGFFQFKNADIPTITRQIARWYDVDIVYEGAIPKKKFTGKIRRDVGVNQLIAMLEYAQVHLKIEGRRIVVSH